VLVLGFDTATPAVSVALHDGERVISAASALDARRHSELLMPMIAKVLADAGVPRTDLDAIAVGVGPGPYTGLRVGLVTARVLGSVLGLPVHGVCSLDIIAAAARGGLGPPPQAAPSAQPTRAAEPAALSPRASTAVSVGPGREFLVATDARRREVYWARYDAVGRRVAGPQVGRAGSIPGAAELAVAGAGGPLYPEAFGEVIGPAYPDAGVLCRLVAGSLAPLSPGLSPGPSPGHPPLLAADPLYLRRPDAREPGPPKRVTPFWPGGTPLLTLPPVAAGPNPPAQR
jgi:tRNA threonylcarbamoyladenosine biosynthesis protein TsaB